VFIGFCFSIEARKSGSRYQSTLATRDRNGAGCQERSRVNWYFRPAMFVKFVNFISAADRPRGLGRGLRNLHPERFLLCYNA